MDKLFAPRGHARTARTPGRRDVRIVRPFARGSLQRVGRQGDQAQLDLDLDVADQEFMEGGFVRTSRAWRKMAVSRRLSPLAALTVNLINKVGAARYRWAAQYFSVAKEKHIQQGFAWTRDLDLARNQAMRSIPRSMGPAEPKLDLAGQGRCWPLGDSRALAPPLPGRDSGGSKLVPAMRDAGADISFRKEPRALVLRLPISKTDIEGKGCERTCVCVCSPQHEARTRQSCSLACRSVRVTRGGHPSASSMPS